MGENTPIYDESPLGAILSSFLAIFLSEIGDRTFFILIVLSMTYSPSAVLVGNQVIMTVMIIISAYIGYAAQLLIDQIYITIISSALFFIFAGLSFYEAFKKDDDSDSDSEDLHENLISSPNWFKTFWKTIVLAFFAEWGDISQLSIITISAVTDPIFTIIGAFFGIGLCSVCSVLIGKLTNKYMPEKYMKILAGIVFMIFGGLTILSIFYEI
ncbi:unnamed protein product [Blepharisma stoltei]|uniref:GDT1 family protein n=1 Tax=Blepharisma stoltei TaxID=1481888 RepID=A0AAU9IAT7_9CILI|nr:unnamed protein product [Blepharisma stoltei]